MSPQPARSHVARGVHCLVLVRHASTEWSTAGRHTGLTDIALDEAGKVAAGTLEAPLKSIGSSTVYSSPLQRALDTCAIAGLAQDVRIDSDLVEWDYGEYEGLTSAEIERMRPGWNLFDDGCPGGESASHVGGRADAFLRRIGAAGGGVVIAFAHGHLLRVLAARWLGLPPEWGRSLMLGAPSISTLVWEHGNPAIDGWNR
jgi:broad specificity phosphatase PhoE